MPVTKTRVCLDDQGNVTKLVFPSWDEELDDAALLAPDGSTAVDLAKEDFEGCRSDQDVFVLLQNHVPGTKFGLRKAIAAKLKKLNEEGAAYQANAALSAAFALIETQAEQVSDA